MEWTHFHLANQLRRQGYTCPLGRHYPAINEDMKFECRLWRAAKGHSQDMADQNYFSHTALDGRSPWERARAQNINANGENIAASCRTPECVLEQWKLSDAHCHNLMNPNFKMFAVAVGHNSNSDWKYYWTQMFTAGEVVADRSCYQTYLAMDIAADDTSATLIQKKPNGTVAPSPSPEAARHKGLHAPELPQPWTASDDSKVLPPELPAPWTSNDSSAGVPRVKAYMAAPEAARAAGAGAGKAVAGHGIPTPEMAKDGPGMVRRV